MSSKPSSSSPSTRSSATCRATGTLCGRPFVGSPRSFNLKRERNPMNEALQTAMRKLRLSGMSQTLDLRLQEAAGNRLSHVEFLELVLQDELAIRSDRLVNRRVKAAAFRERKTLEDFDWQFNPSIKKRQVYELATCQFIHQGKDVLLLGPPGTGKSHLAQAIGYQGINAGWRALYRSL